MNFFVKNREKGGYFLSTGPRLMTWQAYLTWQAGPRQPADVARGTTAPLRRGTEATWAGPRVAPRGGARVALTCGRVPRGQATRTPARGGHVARGGW